MTAGKPDESIPYRDVEISEDEIKKMVSEARREDEQRVRSDPKLKARGKHIMRALIRESAKSSGSTQGDVWRGIKTLAKRRLVAKKKRNTKAAVKRERKGK